MGSTLQKCCGSGPVPASDRQNRSEYKRHFLEERERYKENKEEEIKYADNLPLPLPGKCMIKRTFDLQQDLNALKEKYTEEYEELLAREWKIINQDLYDQGGENQFTIMQFNMLADGLSGAYSNIEDDKTFIGVDKVCFLAFCGINVQNIYIYIYIYM